eukprot:763391-Hanusia_phi.AAC.1
MEDRGKASRSLMLLVVTMALLLEGYPHGCDALRWLRLRGGSGAMQEERLGSMKLSELQKELRAKGLSTKGLKAELIKRLQDAMNEPSKDGGVKRSAPEEERGESGRQEEEQTEEDASHPMKQPRTDRHEEHAAEGGEEVSIKLARPTNQARVVIEREGEDGVVKVLNGYDLKDRCRAAGFKFDAAERAWVTPIFALLSEMGVTSLDQIAHDDIIDYLQRIQVNDPTSMPREQDNLQAHVDGDSVMLTGNTYAWKEKIRSAGFKWDSTHSCWRRALDQVQHWLRSVKQDGSEGEVSIEEDVVKAITEISQADLARASPAQVESLQPSIKVEDGEVRAVK